jgi:putative colanic acid biosynthesis acetyltransferase WcaF
MFAWRAWLLRRFGARVGRQVRIEPTVRIAQPWTLEIGDQSAIGDAVRIYNLGRVRIGARVTISQHAHLCAGTHDDASSDMRLVKAPISVGRHSSDRGEERERESASLLDGSRSLRTECRR